MNPKLKLSEYAAQVCDALEANPTDAEGNAGTVNVTFNPEHSEYRMFISNVIRNAFCSVGAHASDTLFMHYLSMTVGHMQMQKRIEELSKPVAKDGDKIKGKKNAAKKG